VAQLEDDAVTEVKKVAPGVNPATGAAWQDLPVATTWEELNL
jgi:hypothetical protein